MLSLSFFDCLASVAYAMTTLALPSDSGAYGAMGTSATCTAQGFFLQLGVAVPLNNASLSLFYLFTIRHRMHPTKFSRKFEPVLHSISILAPLTMAIVAASMGLIVPFRTLCAISLDEPAGQHILWIIYSLIGGAFLICVWSMASICHFVIRQSRRMRQYSFGSSQMIRRNNETRATVAQALLYTSAFFITYLFPLITLGQGNRSFFFELMTKIFYPLQGFWNFLLYIRPGVEQVKKNNPGKNIFGILVEVIFHVKDTMHNQNSPRRRRRDIDNANSISGREDKDRYIDRDEISHDVEFAGSKATDEEVGPIASNSEKSLQKSSLYIKDKDLDFDVYKNSRRTSTQSNSSTQLSLNFPRIGLEDAEDLDKTNVDDHSSAFTSNKDPTEKVEDTLLATGRKRRVSVKRRVSLIGLATIESHYAEFDLDLLENHDNTFMSEEDSSYG